MTISAWQVIRRPGVAVLMINWAFMTAGFFMLIPFVSVYGTRELGLSAAAVGLVLATRMVVQQGLTIFGGAIADGIGYKPVITLGMFVRMLGFVVFAFAHSFGGLMLGAVIAALGGVMFESTFRASLADLVPPRERTIAFTLSSLMSRIGTMVGPLLAVVFYPLGFFTLSMAAAACFAIAGLLTIFLLPGDRKRESHGGVGAAARQIPSMFRTVWANKPFVVFTALTAGYWFIFNQIFLSLPLYVSYLTSSESAVGALLALNSGFALVAQYPVVAFVNRFLAPMRIIIIGFTICAIGLAGFTLARLAPANAGTAGVVALLILPILVYALGDMLVQPTIQAITSNLAEPHALGSYFGFASFGMAVGGGLGNGLGGVIFDQAIGAGMPVAPWLCYAGLAAALAGAFRWYARQPAHAHAERVERASALAD